MTEGGGRRGEGEATTSEVGASDVRKLVFGAIGGALAGLGPRLVTYPFEVLKSRSQVRTAIHKSAALPKRSAKRFSRVPTVGRDRAQQRCAWGKRSTRRPWREG